MRDKAAGAGGLAAAEISKEILTGCKRSRASAGGRRRGEAGMTIAAPVSRN